MHRTNLGWTTIAEVACALLLTCATRPGAAQSAGNKAAAEALFEQGKLLMQSSDFPRACEKFEASRKLDEGIGTMLYLADCYEKVGRTASAWALFKEAASTAGAQGQESRQKLATQRALTLEPTLVKLTVDVAKENEALLGFEVRNDGGTIPFAQFGTPVPIDPGEHRIEASAPGRRTHSEVINVKRGQGRISIPLLVELAGMASDANTSQGAAPASAASMTPASTANFAATDPVGNVTLHDGNADDGRLQRLSSYVLGGIGVVGFGIGTYYGLSAISKNSSSESECPNDRNLCSDRGVSLRNDALSRARISTAAFAVGGIALAAGVVLYFTAPSGKRAPIEFKTAIGPNFTQLNLEGNF